MNCYCCSGEAKRFGRFQNKNRTVQRYRCVVCGKTFSEHQPLDHLRVSHDTVIQIVKLLTEGMGIRAVSRLTGCHIRTVLEVLRVVGEKCDRLHDKLVRDVETGSLEIDELWSRVGIRQQRTTPEDTERGDQYTYLAVTAREKLILSYTTRANVIILTLRRLSQTWSSGLRAVFRSLLTAGSHTLKSSGATCCPVLTTLSCKRFTANKTPTT